MIKAYKFITADGISVEIENYGNNSDDDWNTGNLGILSHMSQVCGIIRFDVNGSKQPNNFGRDVFGTYITNGRGASLYPGGGIDDKPLVE